jgi:hypothetical protein
MFYHRAFQQDRGLDQDRDRDRSSLKKMIEIPDLFRFITEFMLKDEEDEEAEEEAMFESDSELDEWERDRRGY